MEALQNQIAKIDTLIGEVKTYRQGFVTKEVYGKQKTIDVRGNLIDELLYNEVADAYNDFESYNSEFELDISLNFSPIGGYYFDLVATSEHYEDSTTVQVTGVKRAEIVKDFENSVKSLIETIFAEYAEY